MMEFNNNFNKEWKDLRFSDNYMFCKVMENDELCKELIEILLHIKVSKIQRNQTEKVFEPGIGQRGIRLDVYIKDSDRVFDIEMQTCNYSDLPLRARYYQSAIDVSLEKWREKFENLKEVYILFICLTDPFGYGLPVYTVRNKVEEDNSINYNDKSIKVFYNSSAFKEVKDLELRGFLEYISESQITTSFAEKIDSLVEENKNNSSWEDEYMYFSDYVEEIKDQLKEIYREKYREEGLEEGRQKGIQEGLEEGRQEGFVEKSIEIAKKMIKKGIFAVEDISEITGLSIEKIKELQN